MKRYYLKLTSIPTAENNYYTEPMIFFYFKPISRKFDTMTEIEL